MVQCNVCNKDIEPDKLITCKNCKIPVHVECTDIIRKDRGRPATNCRDAENKQDSEQSEDEEVSMSALKNLMLDMAKKLDKINKATEEIPAMQVSLKFLSDQHDTFKKNQDIQIKDIKELTKKIENLQEEKKQQDKTITELTDKLHEMEQRQLSTFIEISNVKNITNERVKDTVALVAAALNVNDTLGSIERMYRVQTRKNDRPAKIVVKFCSEGARARWLDKTVSRGLSSHTVFKDDSSERIFVSEHQSAYYRRLFYLAKERSREKSWRYVWMKSGRIFARRDESMTPIRIFNESDVNNRII